MEKLMIYEKMAKILKEIEVIKKEKQGQNFKYRGIDDVMNALHESFANNEVFITNEVLERSEVERTSKNGGALFYVTLKYKINFHATDGSSVSSTMYGTAMDSGDKADNKCMSIALKYALLQAFLIPTEDMIDPDKDIHDVKPKAPIHDRQQITEWMSEATYNAYLKRIEETELLFDFEEIAAELKDWQTAPKGMKKEYRENLLSKFNQQKNK
jgi:hypothetical protein